MGYGCSEQEREEEFDKIHMLKITVKTEQQSRQLILEGTLAGVWVDEVRRVWSFFANNAIGRRVVNLTGVSYVDAEGKRLLAAMWREGANLQATGCYTRSIVQDITGRHEPALAEEKRA